MRSKLVLAVALALATLPVARDVVAQTPPPAPRDTARTGIRYLYLVRHGFYDYDDPRDDRIGKGLDSLGRVQARLTGMRLSGLPSKVDRVVSSTLTRAAQTGDLIGEILRLPVTRDSLLSECTPPVYRTDLKEDYPGEHDSCRVQLERAWARYARSAGGHEDKRDVLVCHGNVIRWFVTRVVGGDPLHWVDFLIGNGSITALAIRPDGSVRLAAFSDTGHLPPALQTWTGAGAGWSPPPPPRAPRTPPKAVIAPAPAAAYDTLMHARPSNK